MANSVIHSISIVSILTYSCNICIATGLQQDIRMIRLDTGMTIKTN